MNRLGLRTLPYVSLSKRLYPTSVPVVFSRIKARRAGVGPSFKVGPTVLLLSLVLFGWSHVWVIMYVSLSYATCPDGAVTVVRPHGSAVVPRSESSKSVWITSIGGM